MKIRVGCLFEHDTVGDAAAVVMVDPHRSVGETVLEQEFATSPPFEESPFEDIYGNRCRRLILPPGLSTFSYDAIVEISSENEVMPTTADVQHRIEDLPDELLHWLLPSRYIESDVLSGPVWSLLGHTQPGVERVQAVCDWIHQNIAYGVASVQSTSTLEIYERRGGMCRDFAHMGVAFCRALGIPARYVFGYMPDIGIPGPFPPMDFHAWFEVYLGDRWWTFDARFNTPRIGRVAIGNGRDAADVAMITTFGAASLRRMVVWSDEIGEDGAALPAGLPVEAGVPDVR
ncbi:MAG: hypothetical protein QOH15_1108 [Gaiellales bacterium]|jgi:transglutaminase-like putative cysteine protease|nr:hypothetical protein [Gaiellales bacterium]